MGQTVLLQWTFEPPTRSGLTEIIMTRVLERYNMLHSGRMSVQLRTFRAGAKTLTVAQYNPTATASQEQGREDVAYLVLDDRSRNQSQIGESSASQSTVAAAASTEQASPNGKGKEKEKQSSDDTAEDSDFQIIDGPETTPSANIEDRKTGRAQPREHRQYRTLAVRPAGAVVPMLHNLLSPFVLGTTKSARQAASTTAQQAMPTSLPGIQLVLQSFAFPALGTPDPPVLLVVHAMPPNHNSIILEAEYTGPVDDETVCESILKEMLAGCIPDGAGGERKWATWTEGSSSSNSGSTEWGSDGTERQRRVVQMLVTAMRESLIV